ncbi:MAG: hypothetical protein IAE83_03915 [Anaerolinea sp.]|nr:hypothetical protein [Anaerolinea sp.]
MPKTPYQQSLDLIPKLNRDELLQLIRVITDRLAGDDPEPDDDDGENEGKSRKHYPKVGDMLEWGVIQLRDTLYVEGHENDPALLLDKNTVAYRGQEMRINDWACQITGWLSISIYRHVIVKRLGQTLKQIRKRYMEENGMPNPG